MIKALTRKAAKLFHFVEMVRVEGPHNRLIGYCGELSGDCSKLRGYCGELSGDCSGLSGDCSMLYGNCSGLIGDCIGLYGDCSGLYGNLNKCLLQDEDRVRGVDISDLIKD